MLRGALTIALLASACDRKAAAPPPPPPRPGAADAAASPIVAAPGLPHSIGGLDVEPIAAGSPVPPGTAPRTTPRTTVVGGVRWVDRTGPGAVYLLEVANSDRTTVAIYARSVAGADQHLVREVKDRADACPDRNLTGFAPPSVTVTDVDGDGLAEVGFGYLVGCAGGSVIAKQLLLEGDAKYIVRGSAPDGGEPEPAIAQWPVGAHALADAAYRDNAGALDVADTTGATAPGRTTYDTSFAYQTVEVARTSGGVAVELSYPKLPMLARSEAGDLTTRMRKLLRIDQRWDRNDVGEQTGSCSVGLLTPEVASLSCELLVDVRSRAEHDNATGGSPAGPTVTMINLWRPPARDPVSAAELGVAPELLECAWRFDADGLQTLADYGADRPCAEQHVDWADLRPSSPRATALVDAMVAP